MSNAALELKNVTRRYMQGDSAVEVLRGIDLVIAPGEIVGLVGPSGAGKSTLLHIAGLLDTPGSGEVWVGGVDCSRAGDTRRTAIRCSNMGFVYQFHHLLPEFSALENVMLPMIIAGHRKPDAAQKAGGLLAQFGLSGRVSHHPGALSGGEQQRVAIARAMANDPVVILADEPTGNLDPAHAEQVFREFLTRAKERKLAALIATHNPDMAARMDRVVRLEAGKLINVR